MGGLRILVGTGTGTGTGTGKERANPAWHNVQTDFLECPAAAGCSPDSVDLVILTHLLDSCVPRAGPLTTR